MLTVTFHKTGETGLNLNPNNGRIIHQYTGADYHTDVWLFYQDFTLEEIILQEGETCGKRRSTRREVLAGIADGTVVPYEYAKEWMVKTE